MDLFRDGTCVRLDVRRPGREPFLQRSRESAELRLFLDQGHFVACRGGLEGSLNSRDAATHHEESLRGLLRHGFERFHLLRFDHAHAQVVLGEHLGIFIAGRMAPCHMFPEIHPIEDHPESKAKASVFTRGEQAATTTALTPFFRQVLPDQFHSFAAAQERVNLADSGFTFTPGDFRSFSVSTDSPMAQPLQM